MKIFLDYGELLYNYHFDENIQSKAHLLALKELQKSGLDIDFLALLNAHRTAINSYLRARGDLTEWSLSKIMTEMLRVLDIQPNGLTKRLERIYKIYDHIATPRDGIPELIPQLAQTHSLNLVSNLPHNSALHELHRDGLLPYFDTLTFSYQAGYRKPHPRIYELALEKARTNQGLFLSHDEEEVEGAKKVGLDAYLVLTAEDIEGVLR